MDRTCHCKRQYHKLYPYFIQNQAHCGRTEIYLHSQGATTANIIQTDIIMPGDWPYRQNPLRFSFPEPPLLPTNSLLRFHGTGLPAVIITVFSAKLLPQDGNALQTSEALRPPILTEIRSKDKEIFTRYAVITAPPECTAIIIPAEFQ